LFHYLHEALAMYVPLARLDENVRINHFKLAWLVGRKRV
jgi:hypothetical protein